MIRSPMCLNLYPRVKWSSFSLILHVIMIVNTLIPAYPIPFLGHFSKDLIITSFQSHHQALKGKVQTDHDQRKKDNNNMSNDPFQKFITLEKQRMNKIIEYERKRLKRLNNFLTFEKKRLKELEKQEKKYKFMLDNGLLFNDGGKIDSSEHGSDIDDFSSGLIKIDADRYWKRSLAVKERSSSFSNNNDDQTNNKKKVGWTKLILDPVTTTTTITTGEEFVYMYEPATNAPSVVIMFLGGAGLGQFPHITYSEMLSRIAERLNAVIITTPYQTGLDHYELSKETGVKLHRALAQCQKSGRYSSSLPKYFLGHSLGSKLWSISTAAMNESLGDDLAGIGLISFNNFGFFDTTKQVKTFADAMNIKRTKETAKIIDTILEFAEEAVTVSGIEFSPSPSTTTDRIIKKKYDECLLKKTRLFVFDDDDLDSSKAFVEAVNHSQSLSLSGLPGTHLAPVYIKLELEDYLEFHPEARTFTEEATGGLQSFSYGDEGYLTELVDEVCGWILGNEPTRCPLWQRETSVVLNNYYLN